MLFLRKIFIPQARQRLVLVLQAEASSFSVRHTIEMLVTLHCASSKNWNGNPNAVRDSAGIFACQSLLNGCTVIETTLDKNLRRLQPADFARAHKTLVIDNIYIHDRKIL